MANTPDIASLENHLDPFPLHDASGINYSNNTSGLTASDVQAAIDEIVGGGGGVTRQNTYNNSASPALITLASGKNIVFEDSGNADIMTMTESTGIVTFHKAPTAPGSAATSERWGAGAVASGVDSIVISGRDATASGAETIAIGTEIADNDYGTSGFFTVSSPGSILIGHSNAGLSGCTDSIVIGSGAEMGALSATNAIVIGTDAIGGALGATSGIISIGFGSSAVATDSIAVGSGASCGGISAIAVGDGATVAAGSTSSIALGTGAICTASAILPSAALGPGAICNGDISLSFGSNVTGDNSIGIGGLGVCSNNGQLGVGFQHSVTAAQSNVFGANASDGGFGKTFVLGFTAIATAANQMVLGSGAAPIVELRLGNDPFNASPTSIVNFYTTGGLGTDISGSDFGICPGQGTGTGLGGDLTIETAPAGGSTGSSLNAFVERYRFKEAGEQVGNDTGLDYDWRMESVNRTHALFVDASVDFVGVNVSAPATTLDMDGGLTLRPSTVSLTADNQVVSAADRSFISLSSDDGTASNRTFVLTQSTSAGQVLTIEWTGTNAGELVDDSAQSGAGNHRLSATWTPTQHDTISFISNGTDWLETSRSTN